MKGKEIFVPKIPSYNIVDIAKAINPKAKFKIIGKRPGEKLHEEMISYEESENVLEYKNCYVILPDQISCREYLKSNKKNFIKKISKQFSYSSLNNPNFLNISKLKELFKKICNYFMKINYGFQTIENDDIKSVIKILKSKYLTQGPEVNKFENNLSKKLGSKYCLAVNNGTAALHLAGKALNWKKNDIVITTPTFLSTAIQSL